MAQQTRAVPNVKVDLPISINSGSLLFTSHRSITASSVSANVPS